MLAGVLGFPVRHSRSPAMMNAAFAELGLGWSYLALPVPPELFAETARGLAAAGYAGANVTIPHKLAAHDVADELSPAARAIGAANTLTFGPGGSIAADNTDAGGLLDSLGESPAGKRALVLGAGGAGRAAVWALREAGAEVAVWNRTRERAAALARELEVGHAERPGAADLIVNATSVGLDAEVSDADALAAVGLEGAGPPALFVDLVYGAPRQAAGSAGRASTAFSTPLLRWAERGGARTVDGLEMLVRQGARSFTIWTGREAPLEAMRAGARGALV